MFSINLPEVYLKIMENLHFFPARYREHTAEQEIWENEQTDC